MSDDNYNDFEKSDEEKVISELRDLGFSILISEKACFYCDNNLKHCLEWIYYHQNDNDFDDELDRSNPDESKYYKNLNRKPNLNNKNEFNNTYQNNNNNFNHSNLDNNNYDNSNTIKNNNNLDNNNNDNSNTINNNNNLNNNNYDNSNTINNNNNLDNNNYENSNTINNNNNLDNNNNDNSNTINNNNNLNNNNYENSNSNTINNNETSSKYNDSKKISKLNDESSIKSTMKDVYLKKLKNNHNENSESNNKEENKLNESVDELLKEVLQEKENENEEEKSSTKKIYTKDENISDYIKILKTTYGNKSLYGESLSDCFKTIQKMLKNIINEPDNHKFRIINLNNFSFNQRVGQYPIAIKLLEEIGFKKIEDDKLNLEDIDYDLFEKTINKLDNEINNL